MSAKLLAILLLEAALSAQSGPPPIPVELRARFGFTGPRIVKIGDGIDNLQLLDLDGDGRRAIVVRDGRRARLMALRVQGEQVTSEPIPTDGQNAGYTAADVDGDHRAELLLVDSSGRLHVRSGGKDLQPPFDLGLGGRGIGLLTGDLDGDGKPDLVAFSREGLRWITHLGGTPVASPIEPVEENAHSYLLEDCDGDGKLDLVQVVPGGRMSLRLRRGGGDGTFGAWLLLPVEAVHHVLHTSNAKAPALATIEGATRRVGLYRYVGDGGRGALQWWPFGGAATKTSVPFVLTDVDGDGKPDLVVAQPERARLLLFRWQNGTFVVTSVPTLAGVTSLAAGDIDGDGKPDLVLTSPEEDALAWKSGALPLDAFPVRLPCNDKPLAAVVTPDGAVAAITRNDKRDAHLGTVKPGGSWSNLIDLGRLPADPVRILAADVGDAAGTEYAFVVPGEGLRICNGTAGSPGAGNPGAGTEAAGKPAKAGDVAGFT